jgi:chromatin remodeling complex protein RSC6
MPSKKKAAKKKAAKKPSPWPKAHKKPAKKKAAKKPSPWPKTSSTKPTKKKSARKPNAAFMKALTPSATLAEVIGAKAVPRTEAVKKIWDYIKANGLQDRANRRMINADDKLKPVFGGKKQISMFELAKQLSKNLS